MDQKSSILNLKIAILAIGMVVWGVAEFSMHTFRPNTIQRENRIVSSFKQTSETIWKEHQSLQINTTRISTQLQTILSENQDADSLTIQNKIVEFLESRNSNSDWFITRNKKAFWWSNSIHQNLIDEIIQSGSVLFSNDVGVYIISTAIFTSGDDYWSISSALKIFEIANPNSRYGEVYQASIVPISKVRPTPFYLEGSPDLLPFDHRFSIIRLHADATTGHLALSTYDPDVRNYLDPFYIYVIRTVFFSFIISLLVQICRLILPYDNSWRSISIRTIFIFLVGWSALKLELVRYWINYFILDSIPSGVGIETNVIHFIWLTSMFIPFALLLYRKLSNDRFYDNSTFYSKTSFIIFITGMSFGGLFFLLSEFLGYMSGSTLLDLSVYSLVIKDSLSLIHFIFGAFVSTLVMITIATVSYLFRSIKYHIKTILLLLVSGYVYAYMVLVILFLNDLQNPVIESLWIAGAFLVILGITSWMHFSKRNDDSMSIVRAGLLLTLFLCFVSIPSIYWNQHLEVSDLSALLIGSVKYILLWLVTGALMWSIFNWFSVKKVEIIQSGESLFSGKSELFVLGSVFLLVCIHIGLTQYVKTQVKQEMQSSFQSELTSQQELNPEGFYKVDENGLPVWQATFDHLSTNEVLNYSVYSNLMSSEQNFIMNWDSTAPYNQALSAHWIGNLPHIENPVIFKQTNHNFARIFGAQFSDTYILITILVLFINLTLFSISRFRRTN